MQMQSWVVWKGNIHLSKCWDNRQGKVRTVYSSLDRWRKMQNEYLTGRLNTFEYTDTTIEILKQEKNNTVFTRSITQNARSNKCICPSSLCHVGHMYSVPTEGTSESPTQKSRKREMERKANKASWQSSTKCRYEYNTCRHIYVNRSRWKKT